MRRRRQSRQRTNETKEAKGTNETNDTKEAKGTNETNDTKEAKEAKEQNETKEASTQNIETVALGLCVGFTGSTSLSVSRSAVLRASVMEPMMRQPCASRAQLLTSACEREWVMEFWAEGRG